MADATTSETDWVTALIAQLQSATNGILQAKINGQTVQAFFGKEAISFFTTNKVLLENVGLDAFKNFLLFISQNKTEEAFDILLDKMDADAIIARMNMNAAELQQYNDDYDKFVQALETFAIKVLEDTAAGEASTVLLAIL